MKRTKKLFSLALALVMTLAMAVPSFAQTIGTAADDTATITIPNASKGETYTIYKLFDATVSGDATTTEDASAINYTGTIPDGLKDYFGADSAGNITATKAAYKEGSTEVMSEGLKEALATWADTAIATATAESNGSELSFVGLPYGYYVITTTQGEGTITVDSTKPNATVYDKNSTEMTLSKDVDDINVYIGQTVTYTVTATTTNFDGEGEEAAQIVSYTFEDTLPSFLKDDEVTSIVIDNDADTTTTDDQTTLVAENYQFNADGKITIPWVDKDGNNLYDNGAMVILTYTAVVTEEAVIAGNGNTNTVTMTWNGGTDKLTDTATIWTYAFALKKVNTEGEVLSGATFQLPFYVQKTAGSDGAYIYAGTTAGDGLVNTLTTPENGEILIKGVAHTDEAIEAGTVKQYAITETVAPNGYNKLTEDVIVEVTASTATSTDATVYLDKNGAESATETDVVVTYTAPIAADLEVVVNNAGVELPSTGGMGTTIFYAVGGVMMAGAAILLVTKKKMANEE